MKSDAFMHRTQGSIVRVDVIDFYVRCGANGLPCLLSMAAPLATFDKVVAAGAKVTAPEMKAASHVHRVLSTGKLPRIIHADSHKLGPGVTVRTHIAFAARKDLRWPIRLLEQTQRKVLRTFSHTVWRPRYPRSSMKWKATRSWSNSSVSQG